MSEHSTETDNHVDIRKVLELLSRDPQVKTMLDELIASFNEAGEQLAVLSLAPSMLRRRPESLDDFRGLHDELRRWFSRTATVLNRVGDEITRFETLQFMFGVITSEGPHEPDPELCAVCPSRDNCPNAIKE